MKTTDVEMWLKKPQHRQVYRKSVLFDWQGINWTIKSDKDFKYAITDTLVSENLITKTVECKPGVIDPGYIFIDHKLEPKNLAVSQVFLSKGSILETIHVKNNSLYESGNLDLKINSLVLKFMKKYTGIITVTSYEDKIYSVSLVPREDILEACKIFKKAESTHAEEEKQKH